MKKTLCALILWCSLPLFAQNNFPLVEQLSDQLESQSKNKVADIAYLQTSKDIYETEEDLWFKGYVLDGQYFTPSERSKILFIQLIENQTDKVAWEKKYEIENGFVDGHLFLESSLEEGTYTLAAYTSYSYNGEPKEFYDFKKISIVKSITPKNKENSVEKDSIIHFATFPEGGKLISGIKNNLAFKSVNSKGLPVAISGILFENETPIANFKSAHAGMGVLSFSPNQNKKYQIKLNEPKLDNFFPIAPIESIGKVLSLVENNNEYLIFKITQNDSLKSEMVYLRLQVRGVVFSIARGNLRKELIVKIPLKEIPQGIAEVTLFNENGLPTAERLVYIKEEQKLKIQTELDKKNYATREQVNLKIKVKDQNNEPVVSHLGLSVYDGLYRNKLDDKNIQTHYLLSTQLKGTIYNPSYYFNEQNKNRKEALDLLMLTQGWRSYVWTESNLEDLGNGLKPIIFDEIKGTVQRVKQNKKEKIQSEQKPIMVFSADEKRGNDFIATDSSGVFNITPSHLKKGEGGYTYIKLMTPPEPKYKINIKDFTFEKINTERKNKIPVYPLSGIENQNPQEISPFKDRASVNKLNEVLVKQKKKGTGFRDKYIGKLDSLAKLHIPAYVCKNNILNCPNHRNDPNNTPVTVNANELKNRNSNEPKFSESELLEMFNITMIEGFYSKKVFYEAVYDNISITDPSPDYRNTLLWKPNIITNKDGEASVSFFCSDINSLFLVNIEGVSGDGLVGSNSFQFDVKKSAN